MLRLVWNIVAWISWRMLSLRYKVRVEGLGLLKSLSPKDGLLFLPNHPAHMDPLLLFVLLWPKYRMKPLVVEYIYRTPILKPLMHLVRAVSIPNFDTSVNQIKIQKAEAAVRKIADELKQGSRFVLYPAGRLKNSGKEVIGGASGVHAIVQECPEVTVILVRTSGLWGSSFSRALLGRVPDLSATVWHGIKVLFKNGLFFCPRREITITFALPGKDLPRNASRLAFNRYLEQWYNRYPDEGGRIVDTEPLRLVSYSFFRKDVPQPFQPQPTLQKKALEESEISNETRTQVYAEIRRILDHPGIEISPEMNLATDLGMDSLNIAELISFITKTYRVAQLHPEDIDTVGSALEVAEGARGSERPSQLTGAACWPHESFRKPPQLSSGATIPEAFLSVCSRLGGYAACGDDLVGVLSYKKMKRAALIVALHFRTLPDTRVGIMLPASVGAYLLILALLFAGKVPVMLNWTLGSKYLDEMTRMADIKTVISSWRFLERLANADFGSLAGKIQLLEDLKSSLSLKHKLAGAFLAVCPNAFVLKKLQYRAQSADPAVILFTSGTEASPKGVPLSHDNILMNQRAAMQCINLTKDDVLFGGLPPFHSFGFSVTGLFPLLAGIRASFYPDPTDGFALAEGIERWQATIFCSPPSFLKGLFAAAREEQLKTVRMFVTGAEKTPQELYARVKNLHTDAQLIEGYGITECAPILSLTRFDAPPKGVGQLIPGIELCTIHPETQKLLAEGQEGEICVRGPNVFSGYLGSSQTPFIEMQGKQWYRTGDIGYLDPEGNLILSGRLKRFVKLGGEMISLSAIEESLAAALTISGRISADAPSLALCADERVEGRPQIILFSTVPLDREEIHQILKEAGFSRLIKISVVKKVNEIPLMGTGKTNYRQLQELLR
ncbi:MAG: AMP-binding protein [Chlamydiia bacterium]|nr:AMP-binding protein [Chlamydiia bacterium]